MELKWPPVSKVVSVWSTKIKGAWVQEWINEKEKAEEGALHIFLQIAVHFVLLPKYEMWSIL